MIGPAPVARVPGQSFQEAVKNDERLQQMYAFEREKHYHMPVQKLIGELIHLQATRKFPRLSPAVILSSAQTSLIAARQETAAITSRATHIKMVANVKKRRLDYHLSQMKKYLAETYSRTLNASCSTVKGREALVKDAVEHFQKISYDLETLISTADLLLADLDRSGYAINLDYELVKLGTRPERNI